MTDLLAQIAALPPNKRDLLLRKLKERKAAQSTAKRTTRREGKGPFPLSFSQESLWVHDRLEPASSKYIVPAAVRIEGRLNVDVLQQSLNEIVRRHESWRTSFTVENGKPVQVIAPSLTAPVPVTDLKNIPETDREVEAQSITVDEATRPFDLGNVPLFRPLLIRLDEQTHIFLLTKHHIISDRWSLKLIVEELMSHYESFSHGRPPSLPEPSIQYKDYAFWQRDWLQGEKLSAHLSYWRTHLGGTLPVLNLPCDQRPPSAQTGRGGRQIVRFSRHLADEIKNLQREEASTLFMVMLAAFNTLLSRYSGQDDIIVGAPIANRNKPEIEHVIGFFANILALRTDLSGDPSFRELLRRVRHVTLDGYAHQDLPFEKIVEELRPGREPGRNPLFRVCLTVQNILLPRLKMGDVSLNVLDFDWEIARFDLSLAVWETLEEESPEGGLSLLLLYNADLFDGASIGRVAGHFQTLLESIVSNPDERISRLGLLTAEERQTVLVEWNNVTLEVPKDACFHRLFEDQVNRAPDAAAVVFQDDRLTYYELNRRANQVAHYLRSLGVGPETLAGIYLDRSVDMMVALLGIFKAGAAYVPFDPSYPRERLLFMIEDSQAIVLLTRQRLLAVLPEMTARAVCLDADWSAISRQSSENPVNRSTPENVAYVIYTSGSTGKPKGVMVQHDSLVNLTMAFHEAIYAGRPSPLKVSINAPLSFDASVKQLMQLLHGHALFIFAEEVRLDAGEMISFIAREGLDVLDVTPSMTKILLEAGLSKTAETAPAVVFVAGEAVDESTWGHLAKNEWTDFYNLYGPTECTDDTTFFLIRVPPLRPTIGRQIANIRLYILDAHLNAVPAGVIGELFIGGASPARGYLRRPDATAEKYIPDPFCEEIGARMYKSGDLVRFMPDGNIEFVGRVDHQVKIRGFRIELGEIEAALNQYPGVGEAVVMVREDSPGNKRLVAYVVPAPNSPNIDISQLRSHLEQKLTDYMIPSAWVMLEALPLTPNKKVDKRALPPPDQSRPAPAESYIAPRNDVEEELERIWCAVLGLHRVGVHDNFFKLGGHSLLAIQLIFKVREQFGTDLLLASLLRAPTIADLAELISQKTTDPDVSSILLPLQPDGFKPPLFCIHGAGGQVIVYQYLAGLMGSDQPVYGIQSRGVANHAREHKTIEQMAVDYCAIIQRQQPEGPYHLLGWSMGGVIAVSITKELEKQGQDVAFLGLVDSYLFEDDPFTFDNDPLLGIGLTFGGAFADAFNALDLDAKQALCGEFLALSEEERLARVMEWGQERRLIPAEMSPALFQDQVRLAETHDGLLRAHSAPRINTNLWVWWANDRLQAEKARTEWHKYTAGAVQTKTASGNHFTMLRPPHCNKIAQHLQTLLKKSDAEA